MKRALLASGAKVGEYEIQEKLAEGGMGTVYAAIHPVIGKRAAIKVMTQALCADEAAVSRFVQEARAVNQIGHPNIVDVFSIGELDDGRSYFVMEWLPGMPLGERVARGPVPLADAVAILDQIADAVLAAHAAGIVHRDLKPDNVMLVEQGSRSTVKLLDFGIAKLADPEDRGYIGHTKTGLVMGTPGYMSPEQARGKEVDERTDIYSLGCIAFELVTGGLPFVADNSMDVVIMHVQNPIPEIVTPEPAPDELHSLIESMMAKKAEDRPSLVDVRRILAFIAARLEGTSNFASAGFARMSTPVPFAAPASATPDVGDEEAPGPMLNAAKGPRWWLPALGLALVAGGVLALLALSGGEEAPKSASSREVESQAAAQPEAVQEKRRVVEAAAPGATAKPSEASLSVIAPKGASVRLDDEAIGIGGEVLQQKVSPGKHLLTVSMDGFVTHEEWLKLSVGKNAPIRVELKAVASPRKREPAKGVKRGTGTKPKERKATRSEVKRSEVKKIEVKKKTPVKPRDKDYTLDPFAR